VTEGSSPPNPDGRPGSPFDDQGRLVRGRPGGRAVPPAATATRPGTTPLGPGTTPLGPGTTPLGPGAGPRTVPVGARPAGAWGVPGTVPLGEPSGGGVPGAYGGRPADGPAPLAWARSGAIPLGLTGPFTLTSGLALGRRGRKKPTVSGFDPVVRGRGLARLSRRPQPTTASELQRATVRWTTALWAMIILFQRFSIPDQPVALLLPLCLGWCGYGLFRGVLDLDRDRTGWWLAAAGVSALIVPIQYAFTPDPQISMTAWGLLLVTWLVFLFRLRDRRRSTYLKMLEGVYRVSMWQAALVIVFLASQLVLPYQDWLAQVVPGNLLLHNYTLAYPFSYGGTYYRSNGWIGLETSFTSIQLAFGVTAALLLRKKLTVLLFLLGAIACTGAQSGVQIAVVAVAVILFSPMRWALARYLVMLPTVVAFLLSPLGRNTIVRLTEGTGARSSTGQRSTVPYEVLWPQWVKDPLWVLLGRGPGSSQTMVENSHIQGVLVPTPAKLFFEYGVIAGLALAIFLIFMFLGGPSRAVALAMGSSYWLFQPASTTVLLIITIPLFISWWTPRAFPPLESEFVPSPNAALPEAQRRPRTELVS
jgi:hypothetical protein